LKLTDAGDSRENLTRTSVQDRGPSPARAAAVIASLVVVVGLLATRVDSGEDEPVKRLGRIEVTARLIERPETFPELGAYRYTYVLRYEVVRVHRADREGRYPLAAGDPIFVGHYKPWMARAEIQDADWGTDPLGGRLDQFVAGEAHRMALEYELQDWAPSGVLDYVFPPETNRFFAVWTNPTTL
jgi:hypothetical protein